MFLFLGTINTDNLSLLGLTMDLSGPSAFMDAADPFWTPNASDPGGMYCFEQQPDSVRNGLRSFAQCLSHLVVDRTGVNPVERTSSHFDLIYKKRYLQLMRGRLGLERERAGDSELIDTLVKLLEGGKRIRGFNPSRQLTKPFSTDSRADPQVFFRQLCLFRTYIPPIRNSNLPEVPDYGELLAKWHVERADRRSKTPPDPDAIRKRTKVWLEVYTARVFRESEAW